MRPRNQAERRRQLTNAGRHVLLERGAVGVRVKDIAERAGITPSSVLYYYPRIDELMMEVSREAMERYAERRSRQVRVLDDPVRQLRLTVHLGVPTGPDDEDSRLLYELDAFIGSSPAFRVLSSSFFDRQVQLYQQVLESGAARGRVQARHRRRLAGARHGGDGGRPWAPGGGRPPRPRQRRGRADPAAPRERRHRRRARERSASDHGRER